MPNPNANDRKITNNFFREIYQKNRKKKELVVGLDMLEPTMVN